MFKINRESRFKEQVERVPHQRIFDYWITNPRREDREYLKLSCCIITGVYRQRLQLLISRQWHLDRHLRPFFAALGFHPPSPSCHTRKLACIALVWKFPLLCQGVKPVALSAVPVAGEAQRIHDELWNQVVVNAQNGRIETSILHQNRTTLKVRAIETLQISDVSAYPVLADFKPRTLLVVSKR